MQFKYSSVDLVFLEKLARFIALGLKKGDSISLVGDLGVGKTTFVRFLVHALAPCEDVGSPTFSIINEYHSNKFTIYHIDLYRINSLREVYDLGIESICDDGVGIIEWPDLLNDILDFNLKINIKYSTKENLRDVEVFIKDDDKCGIFESFVSSN
ncbi:tRNA threonylcarbamoyl adenosine modification protein YjeE [Ehrlichia chaffeensis str. Heartland]|nr:tRNA threonylcarbamoyl adenosine modification protein YjeE [Ehrlichia chaffeensis str. Heartland]AHX06106.1 tRNA threonylcarbamoyl adenosine modification protein YjeE [Ehrlichia chaffeensis str. Liberty]AHX07451.1 tRNA threonylcarbamoyl adenosine modification protein YjeE [Ehrlichia chaffeensis str. Osceola]AHX08216.1 tRNA threonylcarbamoyl adenosine modification protein YjeE [Ehrlichia chaffeensis str. Saint Vincent]AHX09789.1 tRNA threonylcarbamoyl adenosine modification protein YjeE [Ehrl